MGAVHGSLAGPVPTSIKPPVAAGRRLSGRRTSRETYPIPVGAGYVPNRLSLTLPLGRLTRDDVSHLMTQALEHTSSEQLVDLVFERSEGNPFYVEELVGYLVETGALTLEGHV